MRLFVVLAAAATLTAAVPGTAAFAHGAPTTPISRSAACAGNGTKTSAAACKAAKAASGGFLGAFDNLRIADVNGNDRKAVPDGKLCSGGLDAYRGLDLPRDDFPSTAVRSGQKLAIAYRGTIPHQGQFRIFLSKPGYSPLKRLTWDDLGSKPLAAFTDPAFSDGAYHMSVTLPQRTGKQMLYVVWQTSSTPDTYYSCSDLDFPAAPAVQRSTAAAPASPASPSSSASPATATPLAVASSAPALAAPSSPPAAAATAAPVLAAATDSTRVGHWLIFGAFGAAVVAGAIALGSRRRRQR